MTGDVDLARVADLFADGTRARILLALTSGRELSASLLAVEAGVGRPTASAHLHKLVDGGLIAVRAEGRGRHYRLAGAAVAEVLERLIALAPPEPVTSLRASTRAAQLRRARSCYDHLAGRLGVGVMRSMLERGFLEGGDGEYDGAGGDLPASFGRETDYGLTDSGRTFLDRLGVVLPQSSRPLVRYCVDWTETRHHLAGGVGRGLRDRFLAADWIEQRPESRIVRITPAGERVLAEEFEVVIPA